MAECKKAFHYFNNANYMYCMEVSNYFPSTNIVMLHIFIIYLLASFESFITQCV